jgi:4-alpha-glucanotransferase
MRVNTKITTPATELKELAELWGVQVEYEDVSGQQRQASTDSLLAVLGLLGARLYGMAEVEDALRERKRSLWRRCLEPVNLAWDGRSAGIQIKLQLVAAKGSVTAQLKLEDGGHLEWSNRLEDLAVCKRVVSDGQTYVVKQLPVPERLPLGHHQLSIECDGRQFESLLIAAPTRAYSPCGRGWERLSGVFLPLYALHSKQSWGAGDFGDLRKLRQWADGLRVDLVGTLPLLPAFLDEPFEISPYSPVSRLFWNEFYLNIEEIPELTASPASRRLLDSTSFHAEIEKLRSAPLVDYRRQMALKRQVLAELARTVDEIPARRAALDEYARRHLYLSDYSAFRALGERFQTPWAQWPSPFRDGFINSADYSETSKRYHMYVQWLADEQIQTSSTERGSAGLYLDLPLGVSADGYDVWRHRDVFAVGAAGGCPPDIAFPKGQNWGFVPLHPEGVREQGYRYVRDYLRHQLRVAKVLRIDHMPSFHRVFWIPPGRDARDGVYVRYPAEEIYAIFCLESHRHKTVLVGEDLGTVPPEVPAAMARHNFHRMHVLQYEVKPEASTALPEASASCLASINTHDMSPFAGFWNGVDIQERYDCGLISPEQKDEQLRDRKALRFAILDFFGLFGSGVQVRDVFSACVAHLCDGPARMVLLNLEDLWEESHSQNVPSTCDDGPNWRRKARLGFEDFASNQEAVGTLKHLGSALRRSDRRPA